MCDILYGGIYEHSYNEHFLKVSHKHGYAKMGKIKGREMYINPGLKDVVYFRITSRACDCDTALGAGDESLGELQKLIHWLNDLNSYSKVDIRELYIIKLWVGDNKKRSLKPMKAVSLRDVDAAYLAGIEGDKVYRVDFPGGKTG